MKCLTEAFGKGGDNCEHYFISVVRCVSFCNISMVCWNYDSFVGYGRVKVGFVFYFRWCRTTHTGEFEEGGENCLFFFSFR